MNLFFVMLVFAFAGYAIGRTVTQESLFEGFRKRVRKRCYDPVENMFPTYDDETNIETPAISPNGYRTDIGKFKSFLMGKFADLVTCPWCASANASVCIGVLASILTWSPVFLFAGFGAAGVTFVINDYFNLGDMD